MKRLCYMDCDSLNAFGKYDISVYANVIEDNQGIIQIPQQEFINYQARVALVAISMQNARTMHELYLNNTDKNIEIVKVY